MNKEDLRKLLVIYDYYGFPHSISVITFITIFKTMAISYNISIAEAIDIDYNTVIRLTPIVHGSYDKHKH